MLGGGGGLGAQGVVGRGPAGRKEKEDSLGRPEPSPAEGRARSRRSRELQEVGQGQSQEANAADLENLTPGGAVAQTPGPTGSGEGEHWRSPGGEARRGVGRAGQEAGAQPTRSRRRGSPRVCLIRSQNTTGLGAIGRSPAAGPGRQGPETSGTGQNRSASKARPKQEGARWRLDTENRGSIPARTTVESPYEGWFELG